jgi:hypothetical protein
MKKPASPSKRRRNVRLGPALPSTTSDTHCQATSIQYFASLVRRSLKEGRASQSETERVLCTLVERFMGAVDLYYRDGIRLIEKGQVAQDAEPCITDQGMLDPQKIALAPYERKQMIDNIGEEWNSLMAMIATASLFDQNDKAFTQLQVLIKEAKEDLNMERIKQNLGLSPDMPDSDPKFIVLPHFGRDFELVSFTYAPTIFIMGVPVNKLYLPWDWSMIWHEVAGIYAQSECRLREREGDKGVIYAVAVALESYLVDADFRSQLRSDYMPDIDTRMPHDQEIDHTLVLNWAKELTEDAIATLCLGAGMATALEAILNATYAQPMVEGIAEVNGVDQHPPRALRIAVSRSLARYLPGAPRADASSDQGVTAAVDRIAALLFEHCASLTNHAWSAEEQAKLDQVLDPSRTPPISAEALATLDPRVKLVATASAVYRQRLTCDEARRAFFSPVPGLRPVEPSADRFGVAEPKCVKDLLDVSFSQHDYGKGGKQACGTAIATNDCYQNPGSPEWVVPVLCTDVVCRSHGKRVAGNTTITHK